MSVPPDFPFPHTDPLEPSDEYARLRREEPMSMVTTPTGDIAWITTRHEDVRAVFSDPRFSRAAVFLPGAPRSSHLDGLNPESLLNVDAPGHARLRRLVAPAFTTRRVEALRERTEQICAGLLDEMAAAGPPADLMAHLAVRLPVTVICELLGVPLQDHVRFRAWSSELFAAADTNVEVVARADAELRAYMAELIAAKRGNPGADLLTALISARDEDDRLSEDELVNLAMTVLVAGHETTTNQIANSVVTLLRHPDQLAALHAHPSLLPQAVEELLRFVSLGTGGGMIRIALQEIELGGITIKAGEGVLPISGAANRDPEVFPEPDRFDIERETIPHLAFGHGIHHCLGAQLARMELQVALAALLRRFPGLRLAVLDRELSWKQGVIINALSTLPVTW
jgi:cytochrome P450